MHKSILVNLIMILGLGLDLYAQTPTVTVPNTFSSGGTISAAEMNANFQALKQAIMDEVVPIGTVISSLVAPDASKDYMSGTSSQVWAYADGTKPASASYSGAFPDLRGKFIRGLDDGLAYTGGVSDPDTGRAVGSLQADAFQGHKHTMVMNGGMTGTATAAIAPTNAAIGWSVHQSAFMGDEIDTNTSYGSPRFAGETRPVNVAVYWYIKVK